MSASSPQPEPPAGLLPLIATGTVSGGVGLLFLAVGAESTLLLLFMLGLIYPLAAAFLAPSLFVLLRALRTRARPLLLASVALCVLVALWVYALVTGIFSYAQPVVTILWASSLAYAVLAFLLGATLQRTSNHSRT